MQPFRFLQVTSLLFALGCSDAASPADVPASRFAASDKAVVYLSQNWSPAESVEFYGLRQGSLVMRKDLFDALEQPDGESLFRSADYLAGFGFLPQEAHDGNPDAYPVGFVGGEALEINCAACHTSRITFGDKEYRIDGAQAMTNVEGWLTELVRAMQLTLADAPPFDESSMADAAARIELDPATKFGRFARRIFGETSAEAGQVYALKETLRRDYERRLRYNDYNNYGAAPASDDDRASLAKHEPYGFGRIDALGAILNQACAEALHTPGNAQAADAPVNFPAIWDAPQHTHVQWNGAVDNTRPFGALGRNAGQVVGVFGVVDIDGGTVIGYDSSVNFTALRRAEELVTRLWSPEWPTEFGLDADLAARGGEVYQRECADCHHLMRRDDPRRDPQDQLVPIHDAVGRAPALGTDDLTARNWSERKARVGPLAGRYQDRPLGSRFPNDPNAEIPARDVLSHVVLNIITRSFVPWRRELTLDSTERMFAAAPRSDALLRYKARPLNGVWSTAPYLHNGSVLNMVELLKPPQERKQRFRVGAVEYDPATLGFVDAGPFEFDTTKRGNGAGGHVYGVSLSDDEKRALLEYIKTL